MSVTVDQDAMRVANRYAGLIAKAETLHGRATACRDAADRYRRDARDNQQSTENHKQAARTIRNANVAAEHAQAARDAEAEAAREFLAARYYEQQAEKYEAQVRASEGGTVGSDGVVEPGGREARAGRGAPIVRQARSYPGGELTITAEADGLRLELVDRGGRVNRSGPLDRPAARKLSQLLERIGPDEDDEADEGRRTNSAATYGPDGGLPIGFAQVTEAAGAAVVELLETDATLTLTAREARALSDDLFRAAAARRVDTGHGPLDVYLTEDKRFGFRLPDGAEVVINGRDWAGISHAVSLVWEGFDEAGETADPEEEISVRHVNTKQHGRLRVERFGDTDNFDRIEITSGVGDWSIVLRGQDREFFEAMMWVEETAEGFGFYSWQRRAPITA